MRCEVCGKEYAEKHHIVFRSQGGLDIRMNYAFLCPEHHRGNEGPHRNKAFNTKLKQREQAELESIFEKGRRYKIKEIAEAIGYDRNRLEKKFEKVRSYCGEYEAEDIIRKIMGGRLY